MANEHSIGPATTRGSLVSASERSMLLDHLAVANRYCTESEHRIDRQHNLIAKLRAQHRTTLVAFEFLRSLQASRKSHHAGRNRLLEALAMLDGNGVIQSMP